MIVCPVCASENGDLQVVCVHCGGYLQTRVQTLDLFHTLWMLIDSPGKAFKRIVLSEQKNYVHFLASVCGIGFVFTWMWRVHAGWFFENLMWLILAGLLSGPVAGIILLYAGTLVFGLCLRWAGSKPGVRNVMSVLSYAMVPFVFTSVILVPLKLAFFGIFMFTGNPSPMVLKPFPYIALLVMDGLAVIWSVVLLAIGTRVMTSKRWTVSLPISVATLAAIGLVLLVVPW